MQLKRAHLKILSSVILLLAMQACAAVDKKTLATPASPVMKKPKPAPAPSGHYKSANSWEAVINGKAYPLCKDLEKNFNSFPKEPPMICARKYRAELGFTTPDWQPVKTADIDWEILKQIYYSLHTPLSKPANVAWLEEHWKPERLRLETLAEQQTILWMAEFDIDNQSNDAEEKEKVVKLVDQECDANQRYYHQPTPHFQVLDSSGHTLDKNYKDLKIWTPDIFFYHGKTYFSQWEDTNVEGKRIYVMPGIRHDIFALGSESCTFQYIP